MIGDPSGRSTERNLLTEDVVATNLAGISKSISSLFNVGGDDGVLLVNNMDFYRKMSAVEFIRDIGRFATAAALHSAALTHRRARACSTDIFGYKPC